MGDPRKIRNKYQTPMHPWQKDRLETENPLMKIYGLKNKKELWKAGSKLKGFKDNAKSLVALKGEQAEKERKQLIEKLKSYGLLETSDLDEILGLKLEQLLDRRLQTIVVKKGLARTVKQARQMITHKQINVNGKKITAPGYLVRIKDEGSLSYSASSKFNDPNHPERAKPEAKPEKPAKQTVSQSSESSVQTAAEPMGAEQ